MTKLQEEVCGALFKAFVEKLIEFINDDATGAHAEWGKYYEQVRKLFQSKAIDIVTKPV